MSVDNCLLMSPARESAAKETRPVAQNAPLARARARRWPATEKTVAASPQMNRMSDAQNSQIMVLLAIYGSLVVVTVTNAAPANTVAVPKMTYGLMRI